MKELQIEVLDSIMGSGKTTGIIKWMKSNPQNKYLYVSPLLSEVEERIPTECEDLGFVSPNTLNHKTKSEHLKELLCTGENVSFTHNLFTSLSKEHLSLISKWNYVLIIDEEIDFIEQYRGNDYSMDDIETLEDSGHIEVDTENLGVVRWKWPDDVFKEGSTYGKLKRMCELGMLHCAKHDRGMIVTHLPTALLHAARRTIVMTYLFKGSVMQKFVEMKGIQVKDFTEISLIKTEAQVKYEASNLIELFETPSTRKVTYRKGVRLTSSWYTSEATVADFKLVCNALRSACTKGKRDEVIYTVPKWTVISDKRSKKAPIRVNGYAADECFLYCGTKATNKYSHKKVLVHAFNRHPMQAVRAYLSDYGFPIDPDDFALSEMIQWIWRSNIREGGNIKLCILSKRMKDLFNGWLDGE